MRSPPDRPTIPRKHPREVSPRGVPYALRRRYRLGSTLTPTHLTPFFYQSIRIALGHRPSLCNRVGNSGVGGLPVRGPWRPRPSWTWRTTYRHGRSGLIGSPSGAHSRALTHQVNPSGNHLGRRLGMGGLRPYWLNHISPVPRRMLPSSGCGLASPGTTKGASPVHLSRRPSLSALGPFGPSLHSGRGMCLTRWHPAGPHQASSHLDCA